MSGVTTSDVRGQVTEEEWQLRVDLAACYRLVAMHGWDDLAFTHLSARVPGEAHHFLINPYGLLFEEVCASNLVKVDLDGTIVMDTPYSINPAGFVIHSAVHQAREDARCVFHLHTAHGVAVGAQTAGLLPISQPALLVCSSLGYHDYEGLALLDEEKPRLIADLGDSDHMFLRNHGTLAVGQTPATAFLRMYTLERACEVQILAQAGGDDLVHVDPSIAARVRPQVKEATKGQGAGFVWPGLLRRADRADPSFRD